MDDVRSGEVRKQAKSSKVVGARDLRKQAPRGGQKQEGSTCRGVEDGTVCNRISGEGGTVETLFLEWRFDREGDPLERRLTKGGRKKTDTPGTSQGRKVQGLVGPGE